MANVLYRYLMVERPDIEYRNIFIRERALYRKPGRSACGRALDSALPGRDVPGSGFHITRKTYATSLLRNGVGMDLVGYQDIETLARFYDVSADYLFGLTDLDQYRNIKINKLRLSDEAIAVFKDGKLNNRLISEFIAHADFPQLLSAMEIFIDRKVLSQMNTMNAMYKYAEQTIKENVDVPENDEMMAFLQQSVVEEDEYLRYRISERFNMLMKVLDSSAPVRRVKKRK